MQSPDEYTRQLHYIIDDLSSHIAVFNNTLPNLLYWVSKDRSDIDDMEYTHHAVDNIKSLVDATNEMKSTLDRFREHVEVKGYPGVVNDDIHNLEHVAWILNKLAMRLKGSDMRDEKPIGIV